MTKISTLKNAAARFDKVAEAQDNAATSVILARAMLGDEELYRIFSKYDGWPNNAETRAAIVADVRKAMRTRTQVALATGGKGRRA